MESVPTQSKKKKFTVPHAFVLIFCLVLMASILTYIVPAGQYDMVEVAGRKVVDPDSFHYVAQSPVGLWGVVKAFPQGLVKQAGIIFMILVIGGAIEIVNRTGALEASIGRLAFRLKAKLYLVVPLLMLCFVTMGAIGVSNAIVAFFPLGLLIAFNLGADALSGIALVGMSMNLGFSGGAFLAATTGTAQSIIGLPLFSGWEFRLLVTLVLWASGFLYLIRYIKRIQKNPECSPVYGVDGVVTVAQDVSLPEFTPRRKLVLAAFILGFGFVVYGAIHAWSANDEIPAVFFATGIVCGLIYGYGPSELAKIFLEGCKKLTFGALIIGVSAAIGIVMTNGKIIHTVIHAISGWMVGLPKVLATEMLYFVNIIINTFITSGSGQAAAVIPIFSPMGDILDITQQTIVLAFQFGDGFTNQILPMSSVTMAGLAFGGVPYEKWLKFVWKWLLLNICIGGVFLAIAVIVNLGPF
ncbi:MAG: hypothetical protein VB049_07460 [Candidatus Pelethousia sp.]|nr:hypothetical protein [Candidatus Pelethousia sp.]